MTDEHDVELGALLAGAFAAMTRVEQDEAVALIHAHVEALQRQARHDREMEAQRVTFGTPVSSAAPTTHAPEISTSLVDAPAPDAELDRLLTDYCMALEDGGPYPPGGLDRMRAVRAAVHAHVEARVRAATAHAERVRKAVGQDDVFFLAADGALLVMLNDVFTPAADCEDVPRELEADVLDIMDHSGARGVIAWAAGRRGINLPANWASPIRLPGDATGGAP